MKGLTFARTPRSSAARDAARRPTPIPPHTTARRAGLERLQREEPAYRIACQDLAGSSALFRNALSWTEPEGRKLPLPANFNNTLGNTITDAAEAGSSESYLGEEITCITNTSDCVIPSLGKDTAQLWDDGALAQLRERFQCLLHSPGSM